jgi:hypothetical protein
MRYKYRILQAAGIKSWMSGVTTIAKNLKNGYKLFVNFCGKAMFGSVS